MTTKYDSEGNPVNTNKATARRVQTYDLSGRERAAVTSRAASARQSVSRWVADAIRARIAGGK